MRFINGHNSHRHTEDTKRRIAEAGRGRRHKPESIEKQRRSKQGPLNPQWKGGRFQSKSYVWVRVGREHPMAMSNGYCLEHRLVEAAALGRMLLSYEHVHHIDGDSLNNTPENLVVLTQSQHSRLHRLMQYRDLSPLDALKAVT